ncbi:MAG: NAD-dependent epimerase/dehydratase family protein [Phycisphaeraceae bacterium]
MIRPNGEVTAAPNGEEGRTDDGSDPALYEGEHSLVNDRRPCLITGGAGFIGTNLAQRLLSLGRRVILLDNLSRPGVRRNVAWLRHRFGTQVELEQGDVRDPAILQRLVRRVSHVFHFAAQVAVTTSIADPVTDFEVNARGTLNLLEAVRACEQPPPLLFTSTNKVYGSLNDLEMVTLPKRYEPADRHLREEGFAPGALDLYSPYGCSKGAADQYVLDYARTYHIPTIVFRMSCIYGAHQFGTEDQGWVAHFLIRAMAGEPIKIYGDGRQVRDVLYVDDLIDAMLLAQANAPRLSGRAFNIGGGPERTLSLLELIHLIEEMGISTGDVSFEDWRVGDQRYYVSSIEAFAEAVGWEPRVSLREGIRRLHAWLNGQHEQVELSTEQGGRSA